jgi:DNA-formamidopyrimidine glycosylase
LPEGPELHASADLISKHLCGLHPTFVYAAGGRYRKSPPSGFVEFGTHLAGLADPRLESLVSVEVKGKFMWWIFSSGWMLWCTYGMSGQWKIEKSMADVSDRQHVAVSICFADDQGDLTHAAFVDPRHFGTVKFSRDPEELQRKLRAIGPDMLGWSMTEYDHASEDFATLLRCKAADRTVAEALMDQRIVSGVGNYVKCEALYRAGVSPWSLCRHTSWTALERLHGAVVGVMRESYSLGGATLRTYSTVDGTRGGFADMMRVYGRKTDPEGREVVHETTPDGRTTHWVPSVQLAERCIDSHELNTCDEHV